MKTYKDSLTTWRISDLGANKRGIQYIPANPNKRCDKYRLIASDLEYGEYVQYAREETGCEHNFGQSVPPIKGSFYCTNYKIIFKSQTELFITQPNVAAFFNVPLGYILSIEKKLIDKNGSKPEFYLVEINTKDTRQLRFIVKD